MRQGQAAGRVALRFQFVLRVWRARQWLMQPFGAESVAVAEAAELQRTGRALHWVAAKWEPLSWGVLQVAAFVEFADFAASGIA
jgi:hypothetical protein